MARPLICLALAVVFFGQSAVAEETPQATVVHLERPIWLLGLEDPSWLLRFRGDHEGASVAVFAFANTSPKDIEEPTQQREDALGRATRSLALFISERIFVESNCRASSEIIVVPGAGPVVSGEEWPLETLRTAVSGLSPDFIVSGAVESRYAGLRSRVKIDIWGSNSESPYRTIESTTYFDEPNAGALSLAQQVIDRLVDTGRCHRIEPPASWAAPTVALVGPYLDALGQLLPQSLAENALVPPESIWGESDMLAWYETLRSHMPGSLPASLIFLRGVLMSKSYGGTAYRSHLKTTVRDISRLAPADGDLYRLSPLALARLGEADACRTRKQSLERNAAEEFAEWLERVSCDVSPAA